MPVCGGVKAYNERSFCIKYYSQGVQTSFYDSTLSASNSLGNTISQRVTEDWENARADFPNASEEHNLRDISRHSRVLIECIPGTQGIWRVAPSYRLKTTKLPRQRSSLSHAHHKLSAEYRRKRRLRIQNRSAGCVLSCTDTSEQQKVPMFCLQKQGMSVSSTSLRSEHCPSGIYSPGTHSGSLPPSSGDSVSRRLADSSSRPSSVITSPVSVTTYTEHGKRSEIRTRTSSGYQVYGASITFRSGESFPPNIQSSGDNGVRMPNILQENLVIHRSVPIHGITQLGLRSHPTGLSTLEALTTTFSFIRSDKPVFTTPSFRPFSPCYPTQAMAGPIVSHIRNPYPAFPAGVHDFHRRLYPGLGRPHGGFSDSRCMDPFGS